MHGHRSLGQTQPAAAIASQIIYLDSLYITGMAFGKLSS
jgi:hypothetical protein